MPIVLVLAAIALITGMMVIGLRQRWIPGPGDGWEPGGPGRWEPGAEGRWEPGEGVEPRPLPRAYWVLATVGWAVLLPGVILGSLFRNQVIGSVALATFAATWIARMIIIGWTDATKPVTRAAAVLRPLALVAGIALTVTTEWPWWFGVGGVLYLGIRSFARYFERRSERSAPANTPSE